jgi:proteic killer suppression protein
VTSTSSVASYDIRPFTSSNCDTLILSEEKPSISVCLSSGKTGTTVDPNRHKTFLCKVKTFHFLNYDPISSQSNITLDVIIELRYHIFMIKSFRDEETQKIFERQVSKKIPPSVRQSALRKLIILDAATTLEDLPISPGNTSKALSGTCKGQLGIPVNEQWRICYNWKAGDTYEVEIKDFR